LADFDPGQFVPWMEDVWLEDAYWLEDADRQN
jgi:hypothetical protein